MQDLETLMRDKLDTHCREQLSAMLDNELAPDQARFLLRRLQHDHELAGCWERWQLCGDLMRGSAPALLPEGFAERVRHALDAESASPQAMAVAGARARWLPWAGSAALAASVAAVALLVGRGAPTDPVAEPASFDRVAAAPASTMPLADPPQPAGALPGTPEDDGRRAADAAAGALAATALAAARPARRSRGDDVPRTRNRAAQRVVVAEAVTDAARGELNGDAAAAVQAGRGLQELQASPVQAVASRDPLLVEVQATARPWPRSPLPGMTEGAFNAGLQGTRPNYGGFEPQLPLQGDREPVAAEAESATP